MFMSLVGRPPGVKWENVIKYTKCNKQTNQLTNYMEQSQS